MAVLNLLTLTLSLPLPLTLPLTLPLPLPQVLILLCLCCATFKRMTPRVAYRDRWGHRTPRDRRTLDVRIVIPLLASLTFLINLALTFARCDGSPFTFYKMDVNGDGALYTYILQDIYIYSTTYIYILQDGRQRRRRVQRPSLPTSLPPYLPTSLPPYLPTYLPNYLTT